MIVSIVDYGMGNLASVQRALLELGATPVVIDAPEQLRESDRIILPGVGSFGDAMDLLQGRGWVDAIHDQVLQHGKPLLGICLGMQLLAQSGNEGGGDTPGLGLIPGEVIHLSELGCTLRVPHVGWNAITSASQLQPSPLLAGIPDGTDFYFVHSYAFRTQQSLHLLASTDYGIPVAAAVGSGLVFGAQFHPEKSSRAGFRLLKNFLELTSC
ncbi:imidazole glycerol phosphate synthase subunit HisH [Paludibacterium yongneupense]|uniref:imidazole glycerol phosphate synthase subunit HisH n=1 Tax=Paludibacterium yongneupense TaxID=400061 RepID=UPI00040C6794|nr:imidazole glycerol phosphate synthase subunit HisH [Paludibacterium yongneupense]